jgi:REP element-mobilizing transposase RayT
MPRALRIEFENALYHVTSRGNERRPIFRNDRDRRTFLRLLGETAARFGWSVTAYVLMTNHFHLVIQTPQPNLSRGMQWLNGTYAGWFNRVHKRCGHLFQGRFHAFLIEKETYFAEVLRYVVLNPVRAKMVERAEDYRWSSYRATAGLEAAPAWFDLTSALQTLGAEETAAAQTEYRSFVNAKLGCEEWLWDQVTNGIYLGTTSWTKRMRKLVERKPRSTDHPKVQRAVGRPAMHEVIAVLAKAAQLPRDVVRSVRGGRLRSLAAWLGWHEGLVTLRSIAAALRLRSEGHISNLIRRCQLDLGRDRDLLATLDSAIAHLRA